MTVERPPKTAREAITRAAAECRRIALRAASDARVARGRLDSGAAAAYENQAQAARDCERAVRALVSKRPPGRPKS